MKSNLKNWELLEMLEEASAGGIIHSEPHVWRRVMRLSANIWLNLPTVPVRRELCGNCLICGLNWLRMPNF